MALRTTSRVAVTGAARLAAAAVARFGAALFMRMHNFIWGWQRHRCVLGRPRRGRGRGRVVLQLGHVEQQLLRRTLRSSTLMASCSRRHARFLCSSLTRSMEFCSRDSSRFLYLRISAALPERVQASPERVQTFKKHSIASQAKTQKYISTQNITRPRDT